MSERSSLPQLLARAFGQAANRALPPLGDKSFSPLSIVSYADGHRMLSITGALVKRTHVDEMRSKIDLESWPFMSSSWTCLTWLNVPDLTIMERMFLEREIDTEPAEVAERLGFNFGRDMDLMKFLVQYRRYYRFYPSLVALEV